MGKLVFMLPGQGSKYVGMGKEFYEKFPVCREVYDLAGEASGLDVAKLCFEENDQLHITEYTQIAMLATEAAIYAALKENGYTQDIRTNGSSFTPEQIKLIKNLKRHQILIIDQVMVKGQDGTIRKLTPISFKID